MMFDDDMQKYLPVAEIKNCIFALHAVKEKFHITKV